jgi:hypothetical protein
VRGLLYVQHLDRVFPARAAGPFARTIVAALILILVQLMLGVDLCCFRAWGGRRGGSSTVCAC